jgi:hypothetical protein
VQLSQQLLFETEELVCSAGLLSMIVIIMSGSAGEIGTTVSKTGTTTVGETGTTTAGETGGLRLLKHILEKTFVIPN